LLEHHIQAYNIENQANENKDPKHI
jgi:hypothetical protein